MPSGVRDIGNSTLNSVSPANVMIDVDSDLCFNVTVDSPGAEYMDRFDVDLPDDWTIVGVHPVAPTGCIGDTIAGQEAGNVVYWQVDAAIPSGCGAWSNGIYDFCARIFVPSCLDQPWSLAWNIIGDGWQEEPHEVNGTTDPINCRPDGLYLTPDSLFTMWCHGVAKPFTLNLLNYTGTEGLFSLTYDVISNNGTISGPDQIYLDNGIDQDLEGTLTPQACLRPGNEVTATITAQGDGFTDLTTIYLSIDGSSLCPECPTIYLPCILRQH